MAVDPEEQARARARQLGEQPGRAADLARRALGRADRVQGRLGEGVEEVRALSRLVLAWARGEYRRVPTASILAALGALVYFLMPLDAIPDPILALGYLDDLAVLGRVVHHIRGDLAQFRRWEEGQDYGDGGSQPDV
jgi:uncharacterized membrane protein YkvA (DUF1232 family)